MNEASRVVAAFSAHHPVGATRTVDEVSALFAHCAVGAIIAMDKLVARTA